MSTFKKVLALTLALAMVLSVSVFAGYKADTYKDVDYMKWIPWDTIYPYSL
jgi:hypothetical protein